MSSPAQVWQYRTLVANLALRDLRSRYKKSILGWAWSLINPAVSLGIYTIVFGVFLQVQAPIAGNGTTKSFAMWIFSALVVWNAFAGGIGSTIQSFLASGPLLTRTYFPPETPVIAGELTVLIQAGIESVILLGFMVALGNLSWTFLLVIPIILVLTCFSLGIGMVVSLYNVRYRDVNYLVGIGLQLLFYATPIVYRLELIHNPSADALKRVINLNPMTHFVESIRRATYLQQPPSLYNWIGMVVPATLVLGLGWWLFSSKAPTFIEEI